MKKAVLSGLNFFDFIGTIIGIIGFLVTLNEIQYRQRPDLSFLISENDFKEMALSENNKPLATQIITATTDFITHDDQNAINELTQITQSHPKYINGYYSLGLIYLSEGYIEKGIADMQVVKIQSTETKIRQQAAKEIILARLAQILTLLAFVSTFGMAILYILTKTGTKQPPRVRSLRTVFIIISSSFVISFFFLTSH